MRLTWSGWNYFWFEFEPEAVTSNVIPRLELQLRLPYSLLQHDNAHRWQSCLPFIIAIPYYDVKHAISYTSCINVSKPWNHWPLCISMRTTDRAGLSVHSLNYHLLLAAWILLVTSLLGNHTTISLPFKLSHICRCLVLKLIKIWSMATHCLDQVFLNRYYSGLFVNVLHYEIVISSIYMETLHGLSTWRWKPESYASHVLQLRLYSTHLFQIRARIVVQKCVGQDEWLGTITIILHRKSSWFLSPILADWINYGPCTTITLFKTSFFLKTGMIWEWYDQMLFVT